MPNKRRIIVGSFATVIAAGAIGVSVTNADFNNRHQNHVAIEKTLKHNNFRTSEGLSRECPMVGNINRRKEFNAITAAHGLRRDGRQKQARQVLEDVGIEHPGEEMARNKRDISVKEAIEHGDWKKFKYSARAKRVGKIIDTKEKFNLVREVHELHEKGRHIEANEIMDELGLRHHHMK